MINSSKMLISGKCILITGGTSGIGLALAETLSSSNEVIVTGRDLAKLELAKAKGLTAIQCDQAQLTDLEQLLVKIERDFPHLDVLINNAGVQYNYDYLTTVNPYQNIQKEIQINLTSTIQLTQLLLPVLSTKRSCIINVTSALGAVPKTDGIVYSVSKAGLRNFTTGLRKGLKGQSIKVLEVIPPVTATEMTAQRDEPKMEAEELADLIIQQWARGAQLIAPGKIRFLLQLQRWLPKVANRLIQ